MGANIRSKSRTLWVRLGESTVQTHIAQQAHPKFFIGRGGGMERGTDREAIFLNLVWQLATDWTVR